MPDGRRPNEDDELEDERNVNDDNEEENTLELGELNQLELDGAM